jgi:hypothetical protein
VVRRADVLVDQPLQEDALEALQDVLPPDRRHVGGVEVPEDRRRAAAESGAGIGARARVGKERVALARRLGCGACICSQRTPPPTAPAVEVPTFSAP